MIASYEVIEFEMIISHQTERSAPWPIEGQVLYTIVKTQVITYAFMGQLQWVEG